MATPKITEALAQKLQASPPASTVEVVVEVQSLGVPAASLPRDARIRALRQDFDAVAAPLAEAIAALGGKVTGTTWLNQTLRASLPATEIAKLDSLDAVQRIDVPHALEPDLKD